MKNFFLIGTGRQIMHMHLFNSGFDFLTYRTLFGGELVLKGFPNSERDSKAFVPLENTIDKGINSVIIHTNGRY
jgi:hypothetical protein